MDRLDRLFEQFLRERSYIQQRHAGHQGMVRVRVDSIERREERAK